MKIEIKPLSQELAGDYFEFFDKRAFSDHGEWAHCYCTWFHMNKVKEERLEEKVKANGDADVLRRVLKSVAAVLVSEETLRGYLAYADGIPVGWCNANDKAVFSRFDIDEEVTGFIQENGVGKIKSAVCFVVAPEFRGKGVATALLDRVCGDAKKEGYAAVEGYARLQDEFEPFDFTGPLRMYEKAGFVETARQGRVAVMRKELGAAL